MSAALKPEGGERGPPDDDDALDAADATDASHPSMRLLRCRPEWTRAPLHGALRHRHHQIIRLLLCGYSTREIARTLTPRVSHNTVCRHMDAILQIIPAPADEETREHITRGRRIIAWAYWSGYDPDRTP